MNVCLLYIVLGLYSEGFLPSCLQEESTGTFMRTVGMLHNKSKSQLMKNLFAFCCSNTVMDTGACMIR